MKKQETEKVFDLIPINGQIICEAPIISKLTKGGLYKTDQTIEIEKEGLGKIAMKVLAVASNITDIKVGDRIIPNSEPNTFTYDDVVYVKYMYHQITCKLTDEACIRHDKMAEDVRNEAELKEPKFVPMTTVASGVN